MSRERLLLTAWALLVLGLAVRAFAGGLLQPTAPATVTLTPHRVDLDRAGVAELTVLPGIGRSRAEAIVLERVRHGPFRDLADVERRVDGLGGGTLQGLAAMVTFGAAAPSSDER